MPQHITISEYNPAWTMMYDEEKRQIMEILGSECITVYHIGSTSVPGLAAKPIIDIMVSARSLSGADSCRSGFEAIGYEWLGEFGIPGRRYLRKGGDERTHQIHIFQCDDRENIERHLAFRGCRVTLADACPERETMVRIPCEGVVDGVTASGALRLSTAYGTATFLGGSLLPRGDGKRSPSEDTPSSE